MGNEKVLTDEILSDAKRKADRARKRAEREAKKILAEAGKKADEAAERTLDVARERADRQAQATLATVAIEVQRDLLETREREFDKLFDAARQRLADKASYDYPTTLATLAAEAIVAMRSDDVVVALSGDDKPIATDAWLADARRRVGRDVTITIAEEPAAIDGGLIVRSADGRLLYDNSFAARLTRLRPDLRRELAATLFAEPPTAEPTGQ